MAKGLSAAKAKKILKDGYVKGKPLTAKQKKYFGAIASGATPLKAIDGAKVEKAQLGTILKLAKKVSDGAKKLKKVDNFKFKSLPSIEQKQFMKVVDGEFDRIDYDHLIPTTQEISDLATKTRSRLMSDKFIKNNMEATGRSKDEILGYVDDYIKEFENSTLAFDKLDDTVDGLYTRGKITIDPRSPQLTKEKVLGVLEHEIEHMFSNVGQQGSDLYRHPKLKLVDDNPALNVEYLSYPWEQQVRFRKALGWLEKNAGLKVGDNVTDEQVEKLTDAIANWSKEQGKDFRGTGANYDIQHLFSSLDVEQFLKPGQYLMPHAPRTADLKNSNVRQGIKDILNKTYAAAAVGGLGAASQVGPKQEDGQFKNGGWLDKFAMGGSLPGASGMMYSRTSGNTPMEPGKLKKAQTGDTTSLTREDFVNNLKAGISNNLLYELPDQGGMGGVTTEYISKDGNERTDNNYNCINGICQITETLTGKDFTGGISDNDGNYIGNQTFNSNLEKEGYYNVEISNDNSYLDLGDILQASRFKVDARGGDSNAKGADKFTLIPQHAYFVGKVFKDGFGKPSSYDLYDNQGGKEIYMTNLTQEEFEKRMKKGWRNYDGYIVNRYDPSVVSERNKLSNFQRSIEDTYEPMYDNASNPVQPKDLEGINKEYPKLGEVFEYLNNNYVDLGKLSDVPKPIFDEMIKYQIGLAGKETRFGDDEGFPIDLGGLNDLGRSVKGMVMDTSDPDAWYEDAWLKNANDVQSKYSSVEEYKKATKDKEKKERGNFWKNEEALEEISNMSDVKSFGMFQQKGISKKGKEWGLTRSDIKNNPTNQFKASLALMIDNYQRLKKEYPDKSEDELLYLSAASHNAPGKVSISDYANFYGPNRDINYVNTANHIGEVILNTDNIQKRVKQDTFFKSDKNKLNKIVSPSILDFSSFDIKDERFSTSIKDRITNFRPTRRILDNFKEGGALPKAQSGRCWPGYKTVSGKTPFSKGSCQKAQDGTSMISQYEEPAWYEKLLDYAASPMTALGYLAKGQDLPDRIPINVPERSEFDNWNFDAYNPAAWIKYGASAKRNFEKGEYLNATSDAVSAIPILPAFLKRGKKLPVKGIDLEKTPFINAFTKPTRSVSGPLPKELEPYLSRRVYPFNKEQEVFESFLSTDRQLKNIDSKSLYYDLDGNIIPNMEYGGEIDKAQWGKLLKTARNLYKGLQRIDNSTGNNIEYVYKNKKGEDVAKFSGVRKGDAIEVKGIRVSEPYRRQGVAQNIYEEVGKESPLMSRSSQQQFTSRDESGRAIAPANLLWEKLVQEGKAEKLKQGVDYLYKTKLQEGGEIPEAQWGALLKLAKKYGNKLLNYSKPAAKVDNTPTPKKAPVKEIEKKVEVKKTTSPYILDKYKSINDIPYKEKKDLINAYWDGPVEEVIPELKKIAQQSKDRMAKIKSLKEKSNDLGIPEIYDDEIKKILDLEEKNYERFSLLSNIADGEALSYISRKPFIEHNLEYLDYSFLSPFKNNTDLSINSYSTSLDRFGKYSKHRPTTIPIKPFNELFEPNPSKVDFGGLFKDYMKNRNGGWLSKYENGGVIEDDRGQWAYPGEITKINSNNITMKGVNYPVLGISDTGDKKMMQPGKDYKFDGNSVTEYPMAKDGKSLVELNQLTNFTNYNTPQPGGWLNKYN